MKQIQLNDPALFNGLCVAADWINDLESNNSRTHKERVIEKALIASQLGSASAQCFLYNCYLAYNPFYVYYIKQVPETQGLVNRSNPWVEFWALLEALRTRSITGHAARDRTAVLSQLFDSEQWNSVCRRVIMKDLRCGITEKTLNRVLKNTDWKIPTFTCQLAQDSTDHPNKMSGHRRLEVKLDGVRVLAVITSSGTAGHYDASVTLFSRSGNLLQNFPHIEQELSHNSTMRKLSLLAPVVVLDGEIVGASFQQLMRQTHRKRDAETQDAVFHIFDVIPYSDFQSGHWNKPQHKRLEILEKIRAELLDTAKCLRVVPGIEVDLDTSEGREVMHNFANHAVDQGFEGIMIKHLDAPYECRRSSSWLKWKPFIEVSLTVVAVEPGTGRNQGRLGALVCEGVDADRLICVNVGSGFSDQERDTYWADQQLVVGQVVEVRADAVTQNQDQTYSLRFPRFLRFRGFEPGEKI